MLARPFMRHEDWVPNAKYSEQVDDKKHAASELVRGGTDILINSSNLFIYSLLSAQASAASGAGHSCVS